MKSIITFIALFLLSFVAGAQCPAVYTVSTGGTICGSTGIDITLSGSQSGVYYQLYNGASTVGSAVSGTGGAIDFGTYTGAGSYTVIGTYITSGCPATMADTSVITVDPAPSIVSTSIYVCNGSFTIDSSRTMGGAWSISSTAIATVADTTLSYGFTADAVIHGVSTGTATLTYTTTSSACGTRYATASVTVDTPITTPITITGPDTVCLRAANTYTCPDSPGIWNLSSYSVATISAVGVLIGVDTGSTVISYTAYNACGGYSGTKSVYVSAGIGSPAIVAPFAISVGDTATLTEAAAGPLWSVWPYTVATISSTGALTGISPGVANIYYATSPVCNSNSTTVAIAPSGSYIGDSFYVSVTHTCSGPQFYVFAAGSTDTMYVATSYGDGSTDVHSLGVASGYTADTFSHTYSASGTYTITQILYSGTTAIDTISYTYNQLSCHDMFISVYYDVNRDCAWEAGTDIVNEFPVSVEIDSAGSPVDTVSVTSGLFYNSGAPAGTVYSFRFLSTELYPLCPTSGIFYDTVSSTGYSATSFSVPLTSAIGTGFDLGVSASALAGRHRNAGTIVVYNSYDTATSVVVTLYHDTRYAFYDASPYPSSITDSTLTWLFSSIAVGATPISINYHLENPGTWVPIGDTVLSHVTVIPISGDTDVTNNVAFIIDTSCGSYDPNYTMVSPAGGILNGTKLHYTVHFENDGNDTAFNIYVLDTLSDNVDPRTLQLEMATGVMNVTYLHYGSHTIAKFDFPGINLLDSSHHDQCSGMVMYNVKARTGLADGTSIAGHAGIYFDDNPVVLTDTALNNIVVPHISVAITTGDTMCNGDTLHFTSTVETLPNTHYQWLVNHTTMGTDSRNFTLASAAGGDTVSCKMTTIMDDSVYSVSNNIILINRGLPDAGTILGSEVACIGHPDTLTEVVTGGRWAASNGTATVAGGIVHAVTSGRDTISYTTTNVCGNSVVTLPVIVSAMPVAGPITGPSSVCPGASITFTDSLGGGMWTMSNSHVSYLGGVVTGVTPGVDTAIYTVTNYCGAATAMRVFTVNDTLVPAVSMSITPGDTVCSGDTITFRAVPVNGGSSPAYQWLRFSTVIGSGATFHYVPANGDIIKCSMTSDAICAMPDTAVSATALMTVNPLVTPANNISTTFGDSITSLGEIVSFNSDISLCGTPATYQWYVNGSAVPGATSYNFSTSVYANDTVYCINTCNTPCATRNTDTSNTVVIYGDYLTAGVRTIQATAGTLQLAPNPNNGRFTLTGTLSGSDAAVYYDVLDITGKVIYSATTTPINGAIKEQITLRENTPSGQYLLRVVGSEGVVVMHFVVE